MNWVDVAILVIIGWFAWRGLTAGLLKGIARLAGIFLGILFALKYDSQLADFAGSKWHLAEKLSKYFSFPSALWNDSMSWWSSRGLSFTGGEQIQKYPFLAFVGNNRFSLNLSGRLPADLFCRVPIVPGCQDSLFGTCRPFGWAGAGSCKRAGDCTDYCRFAAAPADTGIHLKRGSAG